MIVCLPAYFVQPKSKVSEPISREGATGERIVDAKGQNAGWSHEVMQISLSPKLVGERDIPNNGFYRKYQNKCSLDEVISIILNEKGSVFNRLWLSDS